MKIIVTKNKKTIITERRYLPYPFKENYYTVSSNQYFFSDTRAIAKIFCIYQKTGMSWGNNCFFK